ncbi:MAG: hypothetical protein EKK46_16145 [Rhodocyclaceae bacterium]|nr:MAG: hypothetical protein EKK46_16145 [Rhodocyclaceae bacterium]
MRQIPPGTLEVGKPIPFDCYDAAGTLLLRKGNLLDSEKQLESLLSRGLFAEIPDAKAEATAPARTLSPFDLVDGCKSRLIAMLNQLRIDSAAIIPQTEDVASLKAEYRHNAAQRCATEEAKNAMPEGLSARVVEIARVIQRICQMDADAALGHVHLSTDGRYTAMHPLHCGILSEIIGLALGLGQGERIPVICAALTANVAILNLQERLHKQDNALTENQRKLLRLHPALSREMLIELGVHDEAWLAAVLHHHERYDCSGYADGLVGEAIPIAARIVGLTDIYDAMIKPRGYRTPVASKEALRDIFLKRGGKVDEAMAKTLIKEFGIYPPGSFVKLKNGEVAIVFKRGKSATTPLVRSVVAPRGAPLERPLRRDTSEAGYAVLDIAPPDPMVKVDFRQLWDYARA